ncbi:MAG: HU family DNA-binding protein [Muribaculaceae bacterium]|nr:HU family DNA-binding protein [Muribaculaceae bacterium]MDE6537136.1 HU family DNA-binding protein [Muribaculaceae bacterium]MDE6866185.1 HU family DNA-binding protein [Muribaculaceae bacterium]
MENKRFIEELALRMGMDKDKTAKTIEQLSEIIGETVKEEDCVVVPSFGAFEPKKKMERVMTHPSTGKRLLVPPRLTLGFKPSSTLKASIK